MKQTVNLLILGSFLIFMALMVGIRRWQAAHGRLGERSFALLLTGYFSLSFVLVSLPLLVAHPRDVAAMDLFFLVVMWCIGYPWIRWLYRRSSPGE
jgi:hypothetical protein